MKNLPRDERDKALHYIDTLVEVAREPFLILNRELRVVKANDSFYQTFRTVEKETKGKFVYNLGNRQWNISELKKLLEEILPQEKIIRNFEVGHQFPEIGKQIFLLNARQIDQVQLIIVAFENITVRRRIEKKAEKYTETLESEVAKRTAELKKRVKELEELTKLMIGRELKMSELKREITRIKKLKKLNHNNNNNNNNNNL